MSIDTLTKPQTIVDTAVSAGNFTTLVKALQAAGLTDTLKGAGPFTVFAPNDAAFANLPAGALDALLKPENKDRLVAALKMHVLAGKTEASAIAGKALSPTALNGEMLKIDGHAGVSVNGAKVVRADIACSNGVIHVIDHVLMPKA